MLDNQWANVPTIAFFCSEKRKADEDICADAGIAEKKAGEVVDMHDLRRCGAERCAIVVFQGPSGWTERNKCKPRLESSDRITWAVRFVLGITPKESLTDCPTSYASIVACGTNINTKVI